MSFACNYQNKIFDNIWLNHLRLLKYSETNLIINLFQVGPPTAVALSSSLSDAFQVDAVEVRFDYMGTSVLMGRISHLNATINDDWHVTDAVSPTVRPAQGRYSMTS